MQLTHTKVAQNNWLAMRDLHQQREHWKTQFREKFFQKAKDMRNQMTKMTRTQETHNAEIRRIGNNNGHLPSLMTDHNNNNSNGENNPITQTSSFSLQDSNIPDTTFFENHEILNCPNNTNEITSSPPLRGIKTLSDFINAQLEEFSHEERLSEKLTKEEHSEVLHYLEQTVLEELRQEEQALIEQYLQFSSSEIVVDPLEPPNVALCPMCKKNKLLQNKHIIFCKCGLRIDTKRDNITLAYVQRVLVESHREHSNHCIHEPRFEVREQFLITALYMICDACGTVQVII